MQGGRHRTEGEAAAAWMNHKPPFTTLLLPNKCLARRYAD